MKTALLVIDVQTGFFDNEPAVYQAQQFMAQIQHLIATARDADVPVIFIQHDEGLEYLGLLHPELGRAESEPVIHKFTPDSFHETNLQEELQARGIEHLVIVGLQTEWCINATTRRAHELGYGVTLVQDTHTTFDTETESAVEIITNHNRDLGALVTLKPAAEVAFS